jgi:hypothetical protein
MRTRFSEIINIYSKSIVAAPKKKMKNSYVIESDRLKETARKTFLKNQSEREITAINRENGSNKPNEKKSFFVSEIIENSISSIRSGQHRQVYSKTQAPCISVSSETIVNKSNEDKVYLNNTNTEKISNENSLQKNEDKKTQTQMISLYK